MKRVMIVALPLLLLACAVGESETSMAADPPDVSAPTSSSGQDEAQLAGDWRIITIDGAAIPAQLAGQLAQPLTMSFDVAEGRVNGYSGCNRFSGSYRSADRPFALDGLASSKMYCEASADLESRILQALRRVSQFQVDGDSLRLQTASAETALELARWTRPFAHQLLAVIGVTLGTDAAWLGGQILRLMVNWTGVA
jgi:heat shock protein HslJ